MYHMFVRQTWPSVSSYILVREQGKVMFITCFLPDPRRHLPGYKSVKGHE